MILSLDIKNYQSHKNTHIDFCTTTNSLIGDSNSGKTSVLRALSWAITNRPAGDAAVSHWARNEKGNQTEDMEVTVTTDQHVITRSKTKLGNFYIVDGKKLEAVGMDVPAEVSQAFNMSDVNIQKQMDAPFLLAETPGNVAKFFNQLVHLDSIDAYLQSVESKKRSTRTELDFRRQQRESTEKQLTTLDWVPRAKELLAETQELERKRDALHSEYMALAAQVEEYIESEEKIYSITRIIDGALPYIENIRSILGRQKELGIEDAALVRSIQEYEAGQIIMAIDVDFERLARLISKIQIIKQESTELQHEYEDIDRSIHTYESLNTSSIDAEIATLTASIPETCPVCGGPLHEKIDSLR